MYDRQFEETVRRSALVAASLPTPQREQLLALIEETRRRHGEVRTWVARARAALDDWRLVQKYLVFDREARQREAAGEHHDRGADSAS